ncbi:MAG: glycosyltransferase family 2 protein [Chloroflexi bacterium]|nr:glycosyltransferase family 2 protein [Chloroflexota bacterium]
MPPYISVVICTFNRVDLLRKALESLSRQDCDANRYEVIVVDNNSTDLTGEMVRSCSAPFDVRYVLETTQGLSHARNRGWREAQGEYIAYLDDDAIAPPHWLSLASQIIEAHRPAMFGGPVREFTEKDPPFWYKPSYMVALDLDEPQVLGPTYLVVGCNMFCSRRILELTGGFHPDLGMLGNRIGYAEEDFLQSQIRSLGGDNVIFGHPNLYIGHLVRSEKLTWHWIMRDAWSKGRYAWRHRTLQSGVTVITLSSRAAHFRSAVFNTLKALYAAGIGVWFRDTGRFQFPQNYLFEKLRVYLFMIGYHFGAATSRARDSKRPNLLNLV